MIINNIVHKYIIDIKSFSFFLVLILIELRNIRCLSSKASNKNEFTVKRCFGGIKQMFYLKFKSIQND